MVRTLLVLAGAWLAWRIVEENRRKAGAAPVALLPKPVAEADTPTGGPRRRSRRPAAKRAR